MCLRCPSGIALPPVRYEHVYVLQNTCIGGRSFGCPAFRDPNNSPCQGARPSLQGECASEGRPSLSPHEQRWACYRFGDGETRGLVGACRPGQRRHSLKWVWSKREAQRTRRAGAVAACLPAALESGRQPEAQRVRRPAVEPVIGHLEATCDTLGGDEQPVRQRRGRSQPIGTGECNDVYRYRS
jgi:hypothetical protein